MQHAPLLTLNYLCSTKMIRAGRLLASLVSSAPDRATPWCTYGTSRSLAEPEQEGPQRSCWGLRDIRKSGDAQSYRRSRPPGGVAVGRAIARVKLVGTCNLVFEAQHRHVGHRFGLRTGHHPGVRR